MSNDVPSKKKTPWRPFKTFLFCCDCCPLVSGCITVAFVNFVINLSSLGFALYPFYTPRSFTLPIRKWSKECTYLAALYRYSDSLWDVERAKSTTITASYLFINPVLSGLFIIADILLFAGVTKRKRCLITFSFIALLFEVFVFIANLSEQVIACSPKWHIISFKLLFIGWYILAIAVLYSYFIELSVAEELRHPLAAALPNDLRRQLEFPIFDQDVEMIRTRPAQLQANAKKSEGKRDQKNVMLMLRPDILEINKDVSVQSLDGPI